MKRILLSLVAILFLSGSAQAATCYWVGGTGTWNNSTDGANWSSSSGGSGSTCAATGGSPKNASDIAIFDGSSGGGTVTNNVDINIGQITIGAFTGTLDFATNNKNVTLSTAMSLTGSGTKTLNMGSGTWTLTARNGVILWDCTTCANLTLNANTSSLVFAPSSGSTAGSQQFVGGGKTYATVTLSAPATDPTGDFPFTISGNNTITTFNISGPRWIRLSGSSTTTITNSFNWAGTLSAPIMIDGGTGSSATISSANNGTMSWAALTGLTFSGGGTFTATNSFDVKGNSGITITAPTSGGGGIIGG